MNDAQKLMQKEIISNVVIPKVGYSNLRWLCLYAASTETMDNLLETARNLEEICFVPLMGTGSTDNQRMLDCEVKWMTKRLFSDFKMTQFIHVSTRRNFENICDSIQKGLYCTQNRKRDFLEIGLTVDCREITDFNDFMCSVSQIMVGMAQSQTAKWILSLDANCHRSFEMDQESWERAVSVFMTSYKNLNVRLLLSGKWKLVFGSEGCCIMDTHRDWWNDCWKIDFY